MFQRLLASLFIIMNPYEIRIPIPPKRVSGSLENEKSTYTNIENGIFVVALHRIRIEDDATTFLMKPDYPDGLYGIFDGDGIDDDGNKIIN